MRKTSATEWVSLPSHSKEPCLKESSKKESRSKARLRTNREVSSRELLTAGIGTKASTRIIKSPMTAKTKVMDTSKTRRCRASS